MVTYQYLRRNEGRSSTGFGMRLRGRESNTSATNKRMRICDVGRAQMDAYVDDPCTEHHNGKARYQEIRLILAVIVVRLLHWPYFFCTLLFYGCSIL